MTVFTMAYDCRRSPVRVFLLLIVFNTFISPRLFFFETKITALLWSPAIVKRTQPACRFYMFDQRGTPNGFSGWRTHCPQWVCSSATGYFSPPLPEIFLAGSPERFFLKSFGVAKRQDTSLHYSRFFLDRIDRIKMGILSTQPQRGDSLKPSG